MSSPRRSTRSRAADEGSAVVEFVLVAVLLLAVVAGLFQLTLTLHVRNILLSSASEGAHVAALADASAADGAARAQEMASASLGGREIAVQAQEAPPTGVRLVEVTITTAVPILGLWGGGEITVSAHALEESDA